MLKIYCVMGEGSNETLCDRNEESRAIARLKNNQSWALVAQACNPSLLGRVRSEGLQFEASPGKKFIKPHLKQ
jgi:hypothetical protein